MNGVGGAAQWESTCLGHARSWGFPCCKQKVSALKALAGEPGKALSMVQVIDLQGVKPGVDDADTRAGET